MKAIGLTDKGHIRVVNEDSYYQSKAPIGLLPNLFIVADGMGGHNGGEVASKLSIQYFLEYVLGFEGEEDIATILKKALIKANERIYEESQRSPELYGMGTTFVACVIDETTVNAINVGDSRLYAYREELVQITEDHSVVEELYRAGKISEVERVHHPDRNMITRAIGVASDIEVDLFRCAYDEETRILLCSDGLTKMMTDLEISKVLSDERDVILAGDKLMRVALERGGHDNVTLILIGEEREVEAC